MSKTLQFKRYTTSNLASIVGASGELIVDTTLNVLTIHDGVKAGGWPTANSIAVVLGFQQTNTAIQSLSVQANGLYEIANSASVYANSAFIQANAAFSSSNAINSSQNTSITAAFIQANSAFLAANTASNTIPQNRQTTNYVLTLADAGKHIYYETGSNVIVYIPTTANVAFANGNKIMVVSRTSSSANITLSPNTGVSLFAAGNTISGNHNVTTYGVATLMQVAANTWFIQGTGVV
jgi:hypothetical protein